MALWIILGVIVLLIIWIISMYNGLVKGKIKVDNSWSDIRVYMKKRFDLIPNLVNTVKGGTLLMANSIGGTLQH